MKQNSSPLGWDECSYVYFDRQDIPVLPEFSPRLEASAIREAPSLDGVLHYELSKWRII